MWWLIGVLAIATMLVLIFVEVPEIEEGPKPLTKEERQKRREEIANIGIEKENG